MITKFNIFGNIKKGDVLVARILDISQKEKTKFLSVSGGRGSAAPNRFEINIDDRMYVFPFDDNDFRNTLLIETEFAYCFLSEYKFSNKMWNELLNSFNKPDYKLKYSDIKITPSMEKDEQFMIDYRKLSEEGRASKKYNL